MISLDEFEMLRDAHIARAKDYSAEAQAILTNSKGTLEGEEYQKWVTCIRLADKECHTAITYERLLTRDRSTE